MEKQSDRVVRSHENRDSARGLRVKLRTKQGSNSTPPRVRSKSASEPSMIADVRLRRHGRPTMSVRLVMSEICPKWHAEVPDRVVAADNRVAGDSEEDDEEEDDIEQDEEEDTEDEDDGYSE
jgi:hypothetical protein